MRSGVKVQIAVLAALAVAVLVLSLPNVAAAATCTDEFTGPSGGLWEDASNWNNGVPGPSSVVCWNTSTQVDVAGGAQSADSISSGGGLVVRAGTLDIAGAGPSTLSGRLEAGEGGTLQIHGGTSCANASLGSGELLVDGALECALTVSGGGKLSGIGRVASVLNEGGVVEPGDGGAAGGLTVGSYRQTDGTLSVREELAGAGLADHLLHVQGPATLGGTIELAPASPPAGFLVIAAGSEPQGYFTHVIAPKSGSPWTIAYGPQGAAAVSGGAAPLVAQVSGAAQPGGTLTCAPGYATAGPQWQPRGTGTYEWRSRFLIAVAPALPAAIAPTTEKASLLRERAVELFEPVRDELEAELRRDTGPTLIVPGAAIGKELGCQLFITTPAGGGPPSVYVPGESAAVGIGGPYRNTHPPAITGRPIPGARLACSPGRWEGAPGSYSYRWVRGGQTLGTTAALKLGPLDRGTFTCVVTAHYGPIAVPAATSVEVPKPPQPTVCRRSSVVLVSARRSHGAVLLFGAAVQRYFGARVLALRRSSPHGPWRRVGSGRVNQVGYFEIRLPTAPPGGSYRVQIGAARSNAAVLPGVLQIASDDTREHESFVDLRLSPAARRRASVTVVPLENECVNRGLAVATARLAPGGDLRLRLTAKEGEPGYYLATATVGSRTYSVELIAPGSVPRARPL